MCAGSNGTIRENDVTVSMGYYGGNITIGDIEYTDTSTKEERNAMAQFMMKFKKTELVNVLLDLIENAEEG